jgi:hypothetical protein
VAPGANIALIIAPTANDSDLQAAILFAIRHDLGNGISNSRIARDLGPFLRCGPRAVGRLLEK